MEVIPNIDIYDHLVNSLPGLERKGKTTPYTSVNGHMFSFLSKEGKIGLHLSPQDRESFIREFDAKLMVQFGRIMTDYVEVPENLLSKPEILREYLQRSYNYVSKLKPKSTKK